MSEYIFALIYVILGFLGGTGHWIKKRYIDDTTKDTFTTYLVTNSTRTKQAIWSIIGAEVGLSFLHSSGMLSLQEIVGALTAAYTLDSALNRSSEQEP